MKEREALMHRIDFSMLEEMDRDGDGVDENEYTLGMLKILEEVDEQLVDALREQFRQHDKDKSGKLDKEDLALIAEEKRNNIALKKANKKSKAGWALPFMGSTKVKL